MISSHDFNSQWWGGPVGIIHDKDFFQQGMAECQRLLQPFDWVEFKASRGDVAIESAVALCGFQFVDLQVLYKAGLDKSATSQREVPLEMVNATVHEFDLHPSELTEFAAERFSVLPGVTPERICQRYVAWASTLLGKNPELCFEVRKDSIPQGWVFAERTESPRAVNFTLVMTSNRSQVRGLEVYRAALQQFARMGFAFCQASFSAFNVPAHNIHALLGARFLDPVICWIWVNPRHREIRT